MYDLVFQSLSDGILVLDLDLQVVMINAAMQALSDQPDGDLSGLPVNELFPSLPKLQDLLSAGQSRHTLVQLGVQSYELAIKPLQNSQAQCLGYLFVLSRISPHQPQSSLPQPLDQRDRPLLAQEYRLRQVAESLLQTMMNISSNLDHDVIMDQILTQLGLVLPYYSAAVYLVVAGELHLERLVGPEAVSARSYTNPRRVDQVWQVYRERQAQIFLSAHSLQSLDPEDGLEQIYCSMAAPLISGRETLGVLTIDRFDVQPFVESEREILLVFANQASIAIRNAQLYQQAQEAAIIQERNRLAQDLHDAVNQTLFTASIMAEALPRVMQQDPEQGRLGLDEIRRLTQSALAEMRALLLELRPQELVEKPLGDLLNQLVRATSGRIRVPIDLYIERDAILPADVQIALYRITQEAFNNIIKHADPSQVEVYLNAQIDQVNLMIKDNGKGFEIDDLPPGHIGLGIMRARADKIGANLLLISQPARGTRIEVNWTHERRFP